MSSTTNTAPSAASSRPASTRMPALRAEEPVRRSARLCERNPAAWAVANPSAVGLEATATSSSAAGEQPLEIVAAEQLVALRSTPRPLEPLFLGNDAAEEEEERLEAMEVEESVVGRISEVGEDPVATLVGPHVPNYLEIALWAELFIAPVLLVFAAAACLGRVGNAPAAPSLAYLVSRWPSLTYFLPVARAELRALVCTAILAATRSGRGVERAHVTGAGGRGLGEVRGIDRDSDGVADPHWAYAMRIIWSASPRSRRVPVLTMIEEYFDRQRRVRSMRSPFKALKPSSVPGPSSAPESAE
ncbi:uncharacterized protein MEPE_06849 [Melanopsichium pennsylvanicum]|uniref:Uncharacterized protein n=1 Tax=Melanopsichium pennsylvanicum TaxID=63383 RepID=A0AAJ5C8V9_9BASI|nr:uncharacterized protein MEPE_06849 [Melanopsichium pennsylvanicum]